ncbi:flavin-containing monooxygenase [Nocardia fluminea]|uniref:flavin-containing monooxygenase n=1 Tax=Nocardia fluminea TaxID=134984 RepID=UPI003D10264F
MTPRHVEVLIIGAGLSGIGMACQLIREQTGRSFAIIERRDNVGGTWDLFKYPGIRSDSDMLSFGFGFRPWIGTKTLADGPSIRNYIEDTAREYGVVEHIHFARRGIRASYDSTSALWTVEVLNERTSETEIWTANFLVGATGYYDYDQGYQPDFAGSEDFTGQIVHPQHWPEDLDYKNKKVVVIGSGATAITLVPAMAEQVAHITMVQRSPTYIQALPSQDPAAIAMKMARVPDKIAYKIGRARNIALQRASFGLSRTNPQLAKKILLNQIKLWVGNTIDMKHFTPSYNPWDQRLCVVPDGDLFKVLKSGQADIVTDRIARFTETGVLLESGQQLEADIIITATGLNVQIAGGAELVVDGVPVNTREAALYKGVMLSAVPNAVIILGYTNASWTLKADLAALYFCRVLNTMREGRFEQFSVRAGAEDIAATSVMGDSLTSGYITRGDGVMPRQGVRAPWKIVNNYYRDRAILAKDDLRDGILRFDRVSAPAVKR